MAPDTDHGGPRYPVSPADRAGLTAVLSAHWPAAYRLAAGLCGRADEAAAVAEHVLDRAAAAAPRWASAEQAGRWFIRYTVLTARESRAALDTDDGAAPGDVPGLAWLRPLPSQQREAMVLHHGLGLDLHRMAAAMDCSSRAAANHLVAAVGQLRGTGPMDEWAADLPARLAAVVPPAAGGGGGRSSAASWLGRS
jgi:DNA-directed RNA polymerase specialized sigma24 family protein